MRKLSLSFIFLFALSLSAFAQIPSEVSFGYAHETGDIGKNGWNAAGAWTIASPLSIEADLGGYYGGSHGRQNNTHTFTVGPRLSGRVRTHEFTPFGHLLFGFGHNKNDRRDDSSTAFAWLLGGGAGYNFSHKVAVQIKADLVHTSFFSDGQTNLRVGLGLAYRF